MKIINVIIILFVFSLIWSFAQTTVAPFTNTRNSPNYDNLSELKTVQDSYEECTIGVAAGSATTDGRPLLWKTRDTNAFDNEVVYSTSLTYKYVAVITAGQSAYAWMGVNEHGFAIINSVAYDLNAGSSGQGNGELMRYVLGNCKTVEDFENYLIKTNSFGRRTAANFGVIDANGAAAIYETDGDEYWKFDANDPKQAPDGYILRTNFSVTGGGKVGIERYNRTQKLFGDFFSGDTICYKSILRTQMRDFSDADSNPISVPYLSHWDPKLPFGYIDTNVSICRAASASATVVHGVLPGENPKFSTMWTLLGQPAVTIAVPYWPVGVTPAAANGSQTAPLCDVANNICLKIFHPISDLWYLDTHRLRNESGEGIWCDYFSAEDSIFAATDSLLNLWRADTINVSQMLKTETEYANHVLDITTNCYNFLATSIAADLETQIPGQIVLNQNYPNPFNPVTVISWQLAVGSEIELALYNVLGERINVLVSKHMATGNHSFTFDGRHLPSGVYFYSLTTGDFHDVKKMILLR